MLLSISLLLLFILSKSAFITMSNTHISADISLDLFPFVYFLNIIHNVIF